MCCVNVEIEKVCYSLIVYMIDDIVQCFVNDCVVGKCFGCIFDVKQYDSKLNIDGKSESGEVLLWCVVQYFESYVVIMRKDEVEFWKYGNFGVKSGGICNDNGFGDLIDCECSKCGKDVDYFGQ